MESNLFVTILLDVLAESLSSTVESRVAVQWFWIVERQVLVKLFIFVQAELLGILFPLSHCKLVHLGQGGFGSHTFSF